MRQWTALFLAAALLAPGGLKAQHSPDQPSRPTKAALLNADLFVAITDHNAAAAKAALKAGADPNQRNWLGQTPLAWASFMGETETAKLLLRRGARLNDESIYGSALTQAAIGRHDQLGCFLIDKGVRLDPKRVDQATPLMYAASNGSLGLVRRLLQKKSDPNRKDIDGATALLFAARCNQVEAAKLLLSSGARVDMADKLRRTPLHYAATNGYGKLTALLLAHHASVKAVDAIGATPLHLAARYSGDAETIRNLLRAGAPADQKDGRGKTAYALVTHRGYQTAAAILRPSTPASLRSLSHVEPSTADQAIRPSLMAIQTGMKKFSAGTGCVSCHHQGLGVMALGRAAQRNIAIEGKLLGACMNELAEDGKRGAGPVHAAVMDPSVAKLIPAVDIGDFSYGAGYFLGALHANGVPPNPGLAEAALVVGKLQKSDGAWRYGMQRGTMQDTNVTTTALVLQALTAYWPADRKSELEPRLAKARAWLNSIQPRGAEEMAARLLGLKAAGAEADEIAKAAQILLSAQRPDGGWRLPNAPQSDAYTTGFSLYALRTAADIPTQSTTIRKAVGFLLRTQDEDGTWYVAKTTEAYNNHFDAGFPHGYNQYASFAGTCWATIGLLETLEGRSAGR